MLIDVERPIMTGARFVYPALKSILPWNRYLGRRKLAAARSAGGLTRFPSIITNKLPSFFRRKRVVTRQATHSNPITATARLRRQRTSRRNLRLRNTRSIIIPGAYPVNAETPTTAPSVNGMAQGAGEDEVSSVDRIFSEQMKRLHLNHVYATEQFHMRETLERVTAPKAVAARRQWDKEHEARAVKMRAAAAKKAAEESARAEEEASRERIKALRRADPVLRVLHPEDWSFTMRKRDEEMVNRLFREAEEIMRRKEEERRARVQEREERERLQREREERERLEREREERERLEREQEERERLEREERERLERVRLRVREEWDKQREMERIERERARERLERERARERMERERARERMERERARQRMERERREQMERERARAAAEAQARAQAAAAAAQYGQPQGDLLDDDMLDVWNVFERKWSALKGEVEEVIPPLAFNMIPWPVFGPVCRAIDLQEDTMRSFILSSGRPGFESKSDKDRVKIELLRYHPDKFNARVLPYVMESEREAVLEGVNKVICFLTTLR